jgi:hypothetical protein
MIYGLFSYFGEDSIVDGASVTTTLDHHNSPASGGIGSADSGVVVIFTSTRYSREYAYILRELSWMRLFQRRMPIVGSPSSYVGFGKVTLML